MLKVGLIGCGGIASAHHDGFAQTGRARITVVHDADAATASARASEWDARAVGRARDVIESDVEIVVIATPGFAHRDYIEQACAAGKHIMSEKPIALNLEDADAIARAVAGNRGTFMVHFLQRYNPTLSALREVQLSGRIGGTVSAWARLHAPASSARWREIERTGHWRASKELSGGRINEFCSHTVNWLLWVLGKPQTVYGRALYVTEGFGLDDADYALIQCERGTGLLEVNRHAGVAPEENYGILGHGGSVVLKDDVVRLTRMDEKPVELTDIGGVPAPHEHFLQCIENGSMPRNGIDDAIDTLRVCLAFNRSSASGQVEVV